MDSTAKIYELNNSKKTDRRKKSILGDLESLNKKRRIKIRTQTLSDNSYSMFLDIWHNKKRERKFLKIYLFDKPSTRKVDLEKLNLVLKIRDKYELELFQNEHDFKIRNLDREADFIKFFWNHKEAQQKKGTKKPYTSAYNYLNQFTNGSISFNQIDKIFCMDFKDFLLNKVSANTAHTYFARFKAVLNTAIEREIIDKNPARFIQIKKQDVEKEFLTAEEIKILIDTPSPNEQTKRAFLFSCFTGLRFSDIQKLTFNEIRDGYLHFRQEKTGDLQRLPLSANALEIIEKQKEGGMKEGNVFKLNIHDATRKQINKWVEISKINKHVTWHVGRHTFACMAIEHDIDIYTVRDLLGHKDLKNTQIYAKIIDKKKKEAIDKLPKI